MAPGVPRKCKRRFLVAINVTHLRLGGSPWEPIDACLVTRIDDRARALIRDPGRHGVQVPDGGQLQRQKG